MSAVRSEPTIGQLLPQAIIQLDYTDAVVSDLPEANHPKALCVHGLCLKPHFGEQVAG